MTDSTSFPSLDRTGPRREVSRPVGRPEMRIPDGQPALPLALFMRSLREESELTWRDIGDVSGYSYTNLQQQADGRLALNFGTVEDWFNAAFSAFAVHGKTVGISKDGAIADARALWEHCRAVQRAVRVAAAATRPYSVRKLSTYDPVPARDRFIPRPRPSGALIELTIESPQVKYRYPKRVTPDSLYLAKTAADLVESLHEVVALSRIQTGRPPSLTGPACDVLAGRLAPTPALLWRIVAACGGLVGDRWAWEEAAWPILESLRARGRAPVGGVPYGKRCSGRTYGGRHSIDGTDGAA